MDAVYTQTAESIYNRASAHDKPRYIVAIAGCPGSGKTTLANALSERLNAMPATTRRHAVCVPMDGFHLSRAELDRLPNREEAYIRRGAPWTFDVRRFTAFVQELRKWAEKALTEHPVPPPGDTLYAPSFDHEKKDPLVDGIRISPETSIVILEGNYLLLDEPLWCELASLVDFRVFVEADLLVARERVAKRHVRAGIEPTLEDGFRRVDRNDFLNAQTVCEKRLPADLVVSSTDEPGYRS
ncbi:P-loop containing nucleoside triphosphate hydrolase protein [Aspergillus coremiiformis]|uniref:P-loop containing nucleoside triphosphate hydrolase protein n=1 Tax=Aspergillus coremiiformis TaxID=138285 RepID=A0A5N6Z6C6_9EURO|nr:P-loop containing nucleoside triphosphate hydrolase protein [Aspergillus coremiiformis]